MDGRIKCLILYIRYLGSRSGNADALDVANIEAFCYRLGLFRYNPKLSGIEGRVILDVTCRASTYMDIHAISHDINVSRLIGLCL